MNMYVYTLPLRTTVFAMAAGLMLGATPAVAAVSGNADSTPSGQHSSMSSGNISGGGMAGVQLSQNTNTGTGTNGTAGTGNGVGAGTGTVGGAGVNGGTATTGTTGYGGGYGGYGGGGGGGLWGLIGLVGLFGLAGGVRRRP